MKRLLIILSTMILFTACGKINSITQIGTSESTTTMNISNKISDYNISDFDFSAYYFDYYGDSVHEPTFNKYGGTIQDENIKLNFGI